jgi:hypothetical protein
MSWAASRVTTRAEDRAYSLLGLFDVNMPLLYGEGERKAFLRLQGEIMKNSDDHSLFAWTDKTGSASVGSLLASSPSAFADGCNIGQQDNYYATVPYGMTNKGLHIELPLILRDKEEDEYLARLNCRDYSESEQSIWICLRCLSGPGAQFCRVELATLTRHPLGSPDAKLTAIYVRQEGFSPITREIPCLGTAIPNTFGTFSIDSVRGSYDEIERDSEYTADNTVVIGAQRDRQMVLYHSDKFDLRFGVLLHFSTAGLCLFKIMRLSDDDSDIEVRIILNEYDGYTGNEWHGYFDKIDRQDISLTNRDCKVVTIEVEMRSPGPISRKTPWILDIREILGGFRTEPYKLKY